MDTVHDSWAFISHHLNILERPSTPGLSKHHPACSQSALIPQHSPGCDGTLATKPQWSMKLTRKWTAKEQSPLEMHMHEVATTHSQCFLRNLRPPNTVITITTTTMSTRKRRSTNISISTRMIVKKRTRSLLLSPALPVTGLSVLLFQTKRLSRLFPQSPGGNT